MSDTSLSKPEKVTNRDDANRLLAQTLTKLNQMCLFYIKEDLSLISGETIKSDRQFLEKLDETFSQIRQHLSPNALISLTTLTNRLVDPVDKIIPNFYVAFNYAAPSNRDHNYFKHMQDARKHWRKIKIILKS